MPEITRFYGIVIEMYFKDHNPPHFHAKYGEYNGEFVLSNLKMVHGNLPIKAQQLIIEWANKYKEELLNIWKDKKIIHLKPLF